MISERVKKLDEKMAQLKIQKQTLLQREKKQERKQRTHRLVQIGAVIEKYFGIKTVEEAEAIGQLIISENDKAENLKQRIKKRADEIFMAKKLENEKKEKPAE